MSSVCRSRLIKKTRESWAGPVVINPCVQFPVSVQFPVTQHQPPRQFRAGHDGSASPMPGMPNTRSCGPRTAGRRCGWCLIPRSRPSPRLGASRVSPHRLLAASRITALSDPGPEVRSPSIAVRATQSSEVSEVTVAERLDTIPITCCPRATMTGALSLPIVAVVTDARYRGSRGVGVVAGGG
jgi:hypothetical protein